MTLRTVTLSEAAERPAPNSALHGIRAYGAGTPCPARVKSAVLTCGKYSPSGYAPTTDPSERVCGDPRSDNRTAALAHIWVGPSGNGLAFQHRQHGGLPCSRRNISMTNQGFSLIAAESGEPHLPVEPRLVRDVPQRRPGQRPRFVAKNIFAPVLAVSRTFDHDLGPGGRHHREQPIGIDDRQRRDSPSNGTEHGQIRTGHRLPDPVQSNRHHDECEYGRGDALPCGPGGGTRCCDRDSNFLGSTRRSAASSNKKMHNSIVSRLKKL